MSGQTTENPRMRVLLRVQYRDRRAAEQAFALGLSDGLHMNAVAPPFVWEWARNFNTLLVVDLPAYVLALRPEILHDDSTKDLRNSVRLVSDSLGGCIAEAIGKRQLTPAEFLADPEMLSRMADSVLRFELNLLRGQIPLFDPYYEKYRILLDDPCPELKPKDAGLNAIFVPPYFLIRSSSDPWCQVSVEFVRRMTERQDKNATIFATLLLSPQVLDSSEEVKKIADQFSTIDVDGYLLWINGFREEEADERKLRGLVKLVELLLRTKRPVYKLYGSYFSALLCAKGMQGFSCGMGYAMAKSIYSYGKGGKKGQLTYFVGPLGRTVPLAQAEYLLQRFPVLRCDCEACRNVIGTKFDKFPAIMRPDFSQSHFVHALRREIATLAQDGLPKTTERLSRLAADLGQKGVDASHLTRWSKAMGVENR